MNEPLFTTETFARLSNYAAVLVDERLRDFQGTDIQFEAQRIVELLATKLIGRIDVWGQRTNSERVTYPEDWWQSFKGRWFPRWAKTRWPVRWKTVQLEAYAWVPGWLPGVGRNEWRAYVNRVRL